MPKEMVVNIAWAVIYCVGGGLLGICLLMAAAALLPRFIDKMTPNIDEQKEIARGNTAVAEYFGRIVAASILGVSIVIAAAVAGGLIAALY